jgi:hypothetical protein
MDNLTRRLVVHELHHACVQLNRQMASLLTGPNDIAEDVRLAAHKEMAVVLEEINFRINTHIEHLIKHRN